jgi:polyisoprenyl-phosphate glycosyltransferase
MRTLAVVAACRNEVCNLPELVVQLIEMRSEIENRWDVRVELVFVDDGSTDGTWLLILDTVHRVRSVVGIRLTRNFGQQAAFLCGMENSSSDAAVTLDADLQDPPSFIPRLVEAWLLGSDVVLARRLSREGEGVAKKWTAWLFYRFMRACGCKYLVADVGDFRLLSRRCISALLECRQAHPMLREIIAWLGFPCATIPYHRNARSKGTTKYSWWKMLHFALDAVHTLRLVAVSLMMCCVACGVAVISGVAFMMALWQRLPFDMALIVQLALLQLSAIAGLLTGALVLLWIDGTIRQSGLRPRYVVRDLEKSPE